MPVSNIFKNIIIIRFRNNLICAKIKLAAQRSLKIQFIFGCTIGLCADFSFPSCKKVVHDCSLYYKIRQLEVCQILDRCVWKRSQENFQKNYFAFWIYLVQFRTITILLTNLFLRKQKINLIKHNCMDTSSLLFFFCCISSVTDGSTLSLVIIKKNYLFRWNK